MAAAAAALPLVKQLLFPNNGAKLARKASRRAQIFVQNAPKRRSRRKARRRARRTGSARNVQAAPLALGTSVKASNNTDIRVARSEFTYIGQNSIPMEKGCIPLQPGNEYFFPSLTAIASQYTYSKFFRCDLEWTATCGADTAGQICIACVPTYQDYLDLDDSWENICNLPGAQHTNIWKPLVFKADPSKFNTQFPGGFKIVPGYCNIDYDDVTKNQGFVVFAIQGCDATHTAEMGRFSFHYDISLMKSKCVDVFESKTYFKSATATLVTTDEQLGSHQTPWTVSTTDPATTTPDYVVTHMADKRLRPWFLAFQAEDTGNAVNGGNTVATSGCTVTALGGTYSASRYITFVLVNPTSVTAPSVVTITPQLSAGTFDSVKLYVHDMRKYGPQWAS